MQTRYKILIIVCIGFISFSIVFPQVFLIFHLDKYEENKQCNLMEAKWDWYSNTCKIRFDGSDNAMCLDLGGTPSCSNECNMKEGLNPLGIFWYGCLDKCTVYTCELELLPNPEEMEN